jgi:hypothetical protein
MVPPYDLASKIKDESAGKRVPPKKEAGFTGFFLESKFN